MYLCYFCGKQATDVEIVNNEALDICAECQNEHNQDFIREMSAPNYDETKEMPYMPYVRGAV